MIKATNKSATKKEILYKNKKKVKKELLRSCTKKTRIKIKIWVKSTHCIYRNGSACIE